MYYDSVYHHLTIKKKELKPFANQIGMIIRYRIMFTDIYLLIKSYDS